MPMRLHPLLRRAPALAALILITAAPVFGGRLEAIGVRTGLSTTRLSGDFVEGIGGDYRNGFTAAFYWRLRLGRYVSFAPEVAWVERGGDGHLGFQSTVMGLVEVFDFTIENRLQYVEFPLLIRL